jgi:RHS repeat-associated protein
LIEYLVDGENRRVAKKVNGTIVKRWLYRDQLNPVAELDGAGALVAQFVYGTRPNVPDVVVRADGSTYRVISDQLGSPRYAVNVATGAVVFRASFTAFGEPTGTVTGLDWMPFGFAGGLYDPDTKLLRFGVRDYDPAVGRWLSRDPIRFKGGQANLYAYVGNDPVNKRDPTGYIINYDGWQGLVGGGLIGLGITGLYLGLLSNPVGWGLIIVGGAMKLHAMYGGVDRACSIADDAEEDIDTKIKGPRQRQAEQMRELDQLQRDQECGENMSMEGCGP